MELTDKPMCPKCGNPGYPLMLSYRFQTPFGLSRDSVDIFYAKELDYRGVELYFCPHDGYVFGIERNQE